MPTLTKTKTKSPALKGSPGRSGPGAAPKLQQFIGGRWVDGSGDRELVSTNPADTREVVATFKSANQADAVKAIDAAAASAPGWRDTPAPQRGRVIARAVEIARRRLPELARLMTREQGKILPEAVGELEKGINLLEWNSGEGYRFMGETAPSDLPRNLLYTVRQPLGVVSVITPWNFPWAIPCWKIAPALVAGNAVVFKPASNVPAFSVEICRIWEEAGVPPGVLNLVLGSGSSVGNLLVEDPRIRAVSFTGSNSIGKGVHTIAGRRGIKATCEMGGKNPCAIWEDADLGLALGGVLRGAFGSTGQRCTATSRLLIHDRVYDKFMDMLVAETKKIRVGPGLDPKSTMGPAVDQGQFDTDLEYIEIAKKEGARLVLGGRRLESGDLKHGFFVEPTIFDQVKPSMRIWQEEVFGPVLAVARFKTFDEMMKLANDCPFGLTSAIYTQELTVSMRFVEAMEAGMVHVNSPTIGGEPAVPFGGAKGSGVGDREMAKEGVRFFSESKTVFLDYTGQTRSSNIY
ncbi:MAG: aldehyde dehydrogenase family protein [Elusimicrobia bacterium]|nr:aldehyde dehydrogenase family protein [Elusimicrobiota bacterium]